MISLEVNKNPFEALQGLALDSHPLTEFEERPWLSGKSRGHKRLNSRNLSVFDGHGNSAAANNSDHTGRNKNW
jgi:hypothetical protein